MRVLVTGASGLIGRRLVERLTADGVTVTALVRRAGALTEEPGLAVAVGDVEDRASLDRAVAGCDAVVHLANATAVTDAARAEAVNVAGTANVIAAARAGGAGRFIFTSSISAQRARLGPYGRTKRAAEALVRESGLPFVILRPSLVYGGDSGLVVSLTGHLRGLPLMPVIGNGRIAIDPIHLDDVCAVIAACLTRDDVLGHAYDLLGPDRVTFDELLQRLAALLGVRRPLLHIPGPVALLAARILERVMAQPPLTIDNVLGLTSPAQVDAEPARRDFAMAWTPLDAGLRGAGAATAPGDRAAGAHGDQHHRAVPAARTNVPSALQDIIAAAPELASDVAPLRPLRVGIVGLGRMGAAHATVLSMLPNVAIAGAADAAPGAGRRLRGMGFAFPVHAELDALLADGLDAVWVCTPPDSHLPIARRCTAADVAVFVEKPLAHALPAAEELAALASAGPPIACGYTLAFWPSFVAAGRLLQAGVIGAPRRAVTSMHISQVFRPQKGWMFEGQRSGGGVVANLSSHLLFLLQAYFGMPTSVRATWQQRYGTVEDELEATLSAPGCADISFASSWSVPGYPMSVTALRVEGERGVLEVDNDAVRLELHEAGGGLAAGTVRLSEADLPQPAPFYFNGEAYALEDAHVLRWVSGGPAPPITAAAGLRVQRLMTALYTSAAAGGTTVAVPA